MEQTEGNRKFLTDWLIVSQKLLDDELEEDLERMTVDELFELASKRQNILRQRAHAHNQEAEELLRYKQLKLA